MTAIVFRDGGPADLAPDKPAPTVEGDPRPGDVLRVPTEALRDLDPALVDDPATPTTGLQPMGLFAILDGLAGVGASPRPAPGRGGSLIPVPAVAQLRAARAVLRRCDDPAALVAHAAALVMPYESGQWPAGRADTGIRCVAVYLAWRTEGQWQHVTSVPGSWPQVPLGAWIAAVRALGLAETQPPAATLTPAERVEYVAWRLGSALAAVELTDNPRQAARVGAALALYLAWRDELALAEQRRRLAEFDARIDALTEPADPWAATAGGAA